MVDAAYTPDDLIYHMDQGFFESSPGLQMLHCLKYYHFYLFSVVFSSCLYQMLLCILT